MARVRSVPGSVLLAVLAVMAVLNVGFALLFQATRAEAGNDFHT